MESLQLFETMYLLRQLLTIKGHLPPSCMIGSVGEVSWVVSTVRSGGNSGGKWNLKMGCIGEEVVNLEQNFSTVNIAVYLI